MFSPLGMSTSAADSWLALRSELEATCASALPFTFTLSAELSFMAGSIELRLSNKA